jgi:hypothetical protein
MGAGPRYTGHRAGVAATLATAQPLPERLAGALLAHLTHWRSRISHAAHAQRATPLSLPRPPDAEACASRRRIPPLLLLTGPLSALVAALLRAW